jgi:hypothetical protein
MIDILRSRINLRTWAVFIVLVILSLQNLLSEDVSVGRLSLYGDLGLSDDAKNLVWTATKLLVFLPVSALWLLDWRRPLWKAVVVSNALLTFDLLVSTTLLVIHLSNQFSAREGMLVRDTLLVQAINLLIFSLWYWIIDSPRLRQGTPRDNEPWDFLFPQRISSVFGYKGWIPGYLDYLFLAFTASFTFGPADTLPLSQRSKMLMTLQVSISVINIVVLAGYALTAL